MTGPTNPNFNDLPTVKLADVKAGDTLIIDSGFTCRGPGAVEIKDDEQCLYFDCAGHEDGDAHEQGSDAQVDPAKLIDRHYLDGQENEDGVLIGLARPVAQVGA